MMTYRTTTYQTRRAHQTYPRHSTSRARQTTSAHQTTTAYRTVQVPAAYRDDERQPAFQEYQEYQEYQDFEAYQWDEPWDEPRPGELEDELFQPRVGASSGPSAPRRSRAPRGYGSYQAASAYAPQAAYFAPYAVGGPATPSKRRGQPTGFAYPDLQQRRHQRGSTLAMVLTLPLVLIGMATLGATALWHWAQTEQCRRTLGRLGRCRPIWMGLAGLTATYVMLCLLTIPVRAYQGPGAATLHHMADGLPVPGRAPRPRYVPPVERAAAAPATTPVAGATRGAPATSAAPHGTAAPQGTPSPAGATGTPAAGATPAAASGTGGSAPAAPSTTAPAVSLPPIPPSVTLDGFRHQWQTWNNCGPATITMAASYFGRSESQTHASQFLKSNPNDKNVRPDEMVAYARSLGLQAEWRVGGDLTRLKQLLANQIPVVVEVGFFPEPNDWMGHYRLLIGYDDEAKRFIAYDSYLSPGLNVPQPYGRFDDDWRAFNRTYLPIYRQDQGGLVTRILGERDERQMYEQALAVAQAETASQPNNPYAWFNVGTNLVALGRAAEAAPAFDQARSLKLPFRMLWYQFAPFEAYLKVGRLNDVLSLTNANLEQSKDLEESHYYRGRALQAQGQTVAARASYQAALRANSKYAPAYHALSTLN
ncbi:MAG TPA: C39 family peptidase [Chloroflexota bacterium]|nr:C39 family peptidase [Chloroflexota bacterium]